MAESSTQTNLTKKEDNEPVTSNDVTIPNDKSSEKIVKEIVIEYKRWFNVGKIKLIEQKEIYPLSQVEYSGNYYECEVYNRSSCDDLEATLRIEVNKKSDNRIVKIIITIGWRSVSTSEISFRTKRELQKAIETVWHEYDQACSRM